MQVDYVQEIGVNRITSIAANLLVTYLKAYILARSTCVYAFPDLRTVTQLSSVAICRMKVLKISSAGG